MAIVLNLLQLRSIPPAARPSFVVELRYVIPWAIVASCVDANIGALVARKTFAASELLTTVVWAIPVVANILNVLWSVLLRGRRRVPAMMAVCGGICLLVASMGLPPRAWQPWAGWVFAAQFAGTHLLWSALTTLQTSVWQMNYPESHRARIAGRLLALRALITISVMAGLGVVYDHDPDAYHYVYPTAAAIGAVAILALRRLRIRREGLERAALRRQARDAGGRGGGVWAGLHEAVGILRQDGPYRRYMLAQFLLGSANFFTEPLLLLVLTSELGLGYLASVLLMSAISAVVLVTTTPAWSGLYDRGGLLRFRVYNSACWTGSYAIVTLAMIVWMVAGPGASAAVIGLLVIARVFTGLGQAGGAVAWPLGHLAFARAEQANLYLGIHIALTGLRGLCMPLLATTLRQVIGNVSFAVALGLALVALGMFMRMARQAQRTPRAAAPR